MKDLDTISRMSGIAGTLGNDSRMILMLLIAAGEKSVETLSALSGIPVASTSQHLQILKKSSMVTTRREGKHVLYSLQNGPIRELLEALERFAVFRGLKSGSAVSGTGSHISEKEFQKKAKVENPLLIDVRSFEEFGKGHIAGAINIPFEDLKKQAGKLPKDREVVVYCRGPYCLLSVNAQALLRSRGIPALRLASGFSDWSGERVSGGE